MTESAAPESESIVVTTPAGGEIIARRGFWFTLQRCIGIPVMCVTFGGWFLYDGFIKYPASNQRIVELGIQADAAKAAGDPLTEAKLTNERKAIEPHDELGILIQKLLGFSLTPIGLLLGGYFLYRSRGSYRLADGVLNVPGHPPVPLTAISSIDMTRFDKKGIVTVAYELPASDGRSTPGKIVLDDFIYDQDPTDAIIKAIEKSLSPETDAVTDGTGSATDAPEEASIDAETTEK